MQHINNAYVNTHSLIHACVFLLISVHAKKSVNGYSIDIETYIKMKIIYDFR